MPQQPLDARPVQGLSNRSPLAALAQVLRKRPGELSIGRFSDVESQLAS